MELLVTCSQCGEETCIIGSPKHLIKRMGGVRCDFCDYDISEELLKEYNMSTRHKESSGLDHLFDEERQRQFAESLLEKYDD